MSPSELFSLLQKHFAPRERHVWLGEGRAHIELRLADSHELLLVGERLNETVLQNPELYWAEVHQGTGRAVLSFEPGTFSSDEVLAFVLQAELAAGLRHAPFGGIPHPGDQEPIERIFLELVAEALGFVFALGLRATPLPRSRLLGTLASALLVVRSIDRLRGPLDERYGYERVDLALGLTIGLLQGPAQRPLTALVDLFEKIALGSELKVQKRLWDARESSLARIPSASVPRPIPERPRPLPRGPVEEYADRSWAVALAGFGVSFLSTRSVQRAFGALFGGIPRPARLGREIFSASLSRLFAGRQMLVRDPAALRRLDRVDCLVIPGDLLPEGQASIGRIFVCSDRDEHLCRERARALLDRRAPLTKKGDGEYVLAPIHLGGLDLEPEMELEARALAEAGELLLGLFVREALAALVEVRLRTRLGLEELVKSAHDSGMQVIVASSNPEVLSAIAADDSVPAGESLWLSVRELQREGRVVCVVTQGDSRALDVADVGIGLVTEDDPVPWSAHILCMGELDDVRLVIESSQLAREVSRQSVNVALAAATLGAIASVGGLLPLTTGRVLTVVNVASLLSMANGLRLGTELAQRPLLPPRDPTPWHALDSRGVLARLGSSEKGLSDEHVLSRATTKTGPRSSGAELVALISEELSNPLVPILAAGAGLSAVVGSFADAAMVGSVVGLSSVVSGVQKFRTERAIQKLSRRLPRPVVVRRSGVERTILDHQLVRGDLLILESGDAVLADARLLEAQSFAVDASALTGESLPVPKGTQPSFTESIADRSSMLYAGTTVTSGRAVAVVVATGDETEARRSGIVFRGAHRDSGVEKRMRELMELTAPVAAIAGAGVIIAGLLRGRKMPELVGSAVSLAVASVPEGLPILATAAQLAAARRLEKRGALVRNVRALEALGRVDTIGFDKTGTLTLGTVELGHVSDGLTQETTLELSRLAYILSASLRASHAASADEGRADPLEISLWRVANERDVLPSTETGYFERISDIPFESARGYVARLGKVADGFLLSVKGAPEVLLPQCSSKRGAYGASLTPFDAKERDRVSSEVTRLGLLGYRVLLVAERTVSEDYALAPDQVKELSFLGLLAFRDPVRPSVRGTLLEFQAAGIRPILITGDHPSTALSVAVESGISSMPVVMTGSELGDLSEDELLLRAGSVDVYARVSPSQKARVVRALTKLGRTVAMVGDGANDAPAIRLASVGVAMGESASEAARGAADLVLRDARLETLSAAIVEGRAVWEGVRDAVSILVGGNLGEIGFTLLGGLVSGRPPLSPRQLLLVNLFTDVAPATVLAIQPPKQTELSAVSGAGPDASLGSRLTRDITSRALVTATGAGVAWTTASFIGDRRGASTTALLALVGSQLGQTWQSRDKSRDVLVTNLLTALGLGLIVQTPGVSQTFGCRPLGPLGWTIAVGSSAFATALSLRAPGWLETYFPPSGDESLDGLSEEEDEPAPSRRGSLLPAPVDL